MIKTIVQIISCLVAVALTTSSEAESNSRTLLGSTSSTQCSDGIDNDGDGLVDAYSELSSSVPNSRFWSDCAFVRDFYNSLGDTPRLSSDYHDLGCVTSDEASRREICRRAGFSRVGTFWSRSWHSCRDNTAAYFDSNQKKWFVTGACNTGNIWIMELTCENPITACSDGIDNDNDGAIDLADSGCVNARDLSELKHDPGCSSPSDNSEAAQCQDGVDNDLDGAIDLSDFSCSSPHDDDETNPKAQCQDGIDNDGDGAIDLADFSCGNNRQRNDELNPKAQCQDGVDNDQDGLVDTNDPGCSNNQDNNEGDEAALLDIGVECVFDNQDGSFTAYFGYENRAAGEIQVVSDPGAATQNEFSPGSPNRGQPTSFKVGRQKGVVPVTFNGQPLTWKVRAAGSRLSTATASINSTPCQRLTPIADCINGSSSGLVATFGYDNSNAFDVVIPVGALNNVSPVPADRGQPRLFKAGRNPASFSTVFTQSVTWNLDGVPARINESTPICAGGCIDRPIGTIKNELNQTALDLAELTKRAARLLAQRANKSALRGQISKSVASRVGLDAKRAAKKADALARRAQSLTLGFPEVIKSCPFSPPFCQTVNRGKEIDQLRGLFVEQLDQLRRIMARRNFNQTGMTSRQDPLVTEARGIKADGDTQLSVIPRVDTKCN